MALKRAINSGIYTAKRFRIKYYVCTEKKIKFSFYGKREENVLLLPFDLVLSD